MKKTFSSFDYDPSTFDLARFSAKNSLNKAASNSIFPVMARRDRNLVLQYLDSRVAKVFPDKILFFLSISAIFREKRRVKVGLKVQTLVISRFHY